MAGSWDPLGSYSHVWQFTPLQLKLSKANPLVPSPCGLRFLKKMVAKFQCHVSRERERETGENNVAFHGGASKITFPPHSVLR